MEQLIQSLNFRYGTSASHNQTYTNTIVVNIAEAKFYTRESCLPIHTTNFLFLYIPYILHEFFSVRDSSYEDSLGTLVLVVIPTNDHHCVG